MNGWAEMTLDKQYAMTTRAHPHLPLSPARLRFGYALQFLEWAERYTTPSLDKRNARLCLFLPEWEAGNWR